MSIRYNTFSIKNLPEMGLSDPLAKGALLISGMEMLTGIEFFVSCLCISAGYLPHIASVSLYSLSDSGLYPLDSRPEKRRQRLPTVPANSCLSSK